MVKYIYTLAISVNIIFFPSQMMENKVPLGKKSSGYIYIQREGSSRKMSLKREDCLQSAVLHQYAQQRGTRPLQLDIKKDDWLNYIKPLLQDKTFSFTTQEPSLRKIRKLIELSEQLKFPQLRHKAFGQIPDALRRELLINPKKAWKHISRFDQDEQNRINVNTLIDPLLLSSFDILCIACFSIQPTCQANGKTASVSYNNDTEVIIKTDSGLCKIQSNYGRIRKLYISSCGSFLGCETYTNKLSIWRLEPHNKPQVITTLHLKDWILTMVFSKDASKIVITYHNGMITLHDLCNSEQADIVLHKKKVQAFAFSNNTQYLISIAQSDDQNKNNVVWSDLSRGLKHIQHYRTQHHSTMPVTTVAFSPDDTKIAFGKKDGVITIWNFIPKERAIEFESMLKKHTKPIEAITFDLYNTTVTSVAGDGVKVWHINFKNYTLKESLLLCYLQNTKSATETIVKNSFLHKLYKNLSVEKKLTLGLLF